MRRQPPRSTRTDTLFPYTTLFRSHAQVEVMVEVTRNPLQLVVDVVIECRGDIDLMAGNLDPHGELLCWGCRSGMARHTKAWSCPIRLTLSSEERRLGKECVSTCSARCSPYP